MLLLIINNWLYWDLFAYKAVDLKLQFAIILTFGGNVKV